MLGGGRPGGRTRMSPAAGDRRPGLEHSKEGPCEEAMDGRCGERPRPGSQELRPVPGAMLSQWRERFRSQARVRCPRPGCCLDFPSLYGLKYHYQRCQGVPPAERQSHHCPHCKGVFSTEARLRKHLAWSHPGWALRAPARLRFGAPELSPTRKTSGKRPTKSPNPIPGVPKVLKAQHTAHPAQNGERVPQTQPSSSSSSDSSSWTSASSGSESDSPSPLLQEAEEHEEAEEEEKDLERSRHRRKQKTPKKFTGDQPSISGTFGLKGLTQSEDRPKGRGAGADWNGFTQGCMRKTPPASHPEHPDGRGWPTLIERSRGPVRRPLPALPRRTEVCQKLQDALSCSQCRRQFCSRAGLEFHTAVEHSDKNRCGREVEEVKVPVFQCQHCGKNYRSKAGRDYHLRSAHATATTSAAMGPKRQQPNEGREKGENLDDGGSEKEEQMEEEVEEEEHRDDSSTEEEEQQEPGDTKREGRCERMPTEEEEQATRLMSTEEEGQPEHVLTMEEGRPEVTEEDFGRTPSGRVRRRSAQVAVFHLQEIAEDELASDWGGRRHRRDDLVPDSRKLNYTRPRPLTLSPGTVERWRMELKEKGFICCPNTGCEAVYTSAAGLKAHLAGCEKGGGSAGKYTCLLCQKEFGSESGVKYHIGKTHSQNWFRSTNHPGPSSGSKGSQNGLKGASESSATVKKRGRKPKERPPDGSDESEAGACSVRD
ncbi:zinc finger protein 512B-like [Paramormyrops kingsleyae]|uniref:Zinc finger protein 512B-like n=1 Tax=Paramormyrops kingsleyae TaxID=1676925 RepID=A0A3B3RT48_9TELE|nr:zinc finger protein 512B-like [Paramormyrops kingsleyae]XP_023652470.1 zinc finger protein 512B-like [Paramormyrops kingsleyae]XP_023652471.1 zinc finger protein 512B-like [Paramormyrops kingsleyae]